MTKTVTCLLALLLVAAIPASAQPLVVRADRMLDVESGEVISPAVVVVEHGLSTTGGHGDAGGLAVRYQIKHGAKAIKVSAKAGVLSFEGPVSAQHYAADELRVIPSTTSASWRTYAL